MTAHTVSVACPVCRHGFPVDELQFANLTGKRDIFLALRCPSCSVISNYRIADLRKALAQPSGAADR